MKQLLAITVILALSRTTLCEICNVNPTWGLRLDNRNLGDDFNEFKEMISYKDIKNLVFEYFNEDFEFRELVDYLLTGKTKEMILEVENIAGIKSAIAYLREHGVNIHEVINDFHHLLAMNDYTPVMKKKIIGGLAGFVKELKKLIPYEDLKDLYDEKMRISSEFRKAVEFFSRSAALVEAEKNGKVQNFAAFLEKRHVELREVIGLLHQVLGIPISFRNAVNPLHRILGIAKTLGDDLKDFQNLIDHDKIEKILLKYLNNDAEFQDFLADILSENTKEMVEEIESTLEVRQIFTYLHESNVDIYETLKIVHELLDLEEYKPLMRSQMTKGLSDFVEDIKAVIPFEEIKALYQDKLLTSQAFRDAVEFFKSATVRTAFEKVKENPRVQEIVKYLEDKHLDIHEVIDLFHQLTGLPIFRHGSVHDLDEDFHDFEHLLPLNEIKDLLVRSFYNNTGFIAFTKYLHSADMKAAILDIESVQEVNNFIGYLDDNGVHIHALLNSIHEWYGLDSYQPSKISISQRFYPNSLEVFFEELDSLIPIDQIHELYDEKLDTCEEFQDFVAYLKTEEVQSMVKTISAHPQVQNIVAYLKKRHVHASNIQKIYKTLFVNNV